MSDITGLREFCYHCGKVTATNPVKVTAGFDYRCAVCGHTVDQDFDEDYFDDDNEPIGSCEECGTNLYPGDDCDEAGDGLCDQCAFYRAHGSSGGSEVIG